MNDDVILNKAAIIERCIQRIKEEYSEGEFTLNYTKQDAIILNLLRAIEAAIDMTTRVIRLKKLGIPQSSREVFTLLEEAKIISSELSQKLQAMVGFKNIAVDDYTRLNLEIIKSIIKNNLPNVSQFSKQILSL